MTARAVVAANGVVEVALGVLASSYWLLILLVFMILDTWRRVWKRAGRDVWLVRVSQIIVGAIALLLVPLLIAGFYVGVLFLFQWLDERREKKKPSRKASPIDNALAQVWGLVAAYFISGGAVWLPPEVLTLEAEQPVVAYVLASDAQWTSVLGEADRRVSIHLSSDIRTRTLCTTGIDRNPFALVEVILPNATDPPSCDEVLLDLRQ